MSTTEHDPDPSAAPAADPSPPTNPLLLARRREVVELYRPGVEERLDELQAELEEIEALREAGGGPPQKQGRKDPAMVKAEEYDRLAAEASVLRITLVEPGYDDVSTLWQHHPPRDGHRIDARLGYNPETYATALVRICMVDPVVTDEQYAEFRESVSLFNWSKLTNAASKLTNQEPDLPLPLAVSSLQRARETASQQQRGTASRRGGSRA